MSKENEWTEFQRLTDDSAAGSTEEVGEISAGLKKGSKSLKILNPGDEEFRKEGTE